MFERSIVGLDVGCYSIKAVELRADLRETELFRLEELLLPAAASPDEVEERAEVFLNELGFPLEQVVAALPSEHVTQRRLHFPFTGARKVKQAIDFQIQEELPFRLDQTVRSHELLETAESATNVLVVIAQRSEVDARLETLRRIGVEPRVLEAEGAVLANLWPYLTQGSGPALVLDVGHSKTNLCLVADGRPVALRRLPVAGYHLTQAIAQDRGLSFADAQAYKHEYGAFECGSTKPASPAVRATLDRLARETVRSLQSVVSHAGDPVAPSRLLLVGGSAELSGLGGYLREHTGLQPVEFALEEGPRLGLAPGRYAQACALALRGAGGKAATRIDFRQQEFSYTADLSALRGQLRLTLGLFGLALALWLAASAVRMVTGEGHVQALERSLGAIHQQTFPGSRADGDVMRAMELEFGRTRELADHLGVTSSGLSVLDTLREISTRVPAELGITLDELRIDRKSVTGRGHTPDFVSADELRRQLAATAGFGKVLVSDVTNDTRRGGKNFTLRIQLEDDS